MSLSLKNKLVYTIMVSGTLILMATIGIYVTINIVSLKKNKINDINVLAKIIAENNQAALLFNDTTVAKESLYSLISNKDIEYVCILNSNHQLFAESNFTNSKIVLPENKKSVGKQSDIIEVLYDINYQGNTIGSLYIKSNFNQVNEQINRAIIIGILILILALIATYILTNIIQKIIINPILKLASTAALISDEKDYSTTINIKRDDEIGMLVDSFNNMLSEINKQNTELVDSKKKAEYSSKAKEQFLANMSHEIRTPINGIDGMAKLLEKTLLSPTQKEFVSAIRISSDNLLVIINDILDISKIEAGKLSLEKIGFNIKEVLFQTIKSCYYKAEEKGIILESSIDKNIADILIGDPTRIGQIIINLLNNAIKFTSEGSVKLNCSLIKATKNSNLIIFEVIDTGIGIETNKLTTIFESFSQEDSSTTRKYGGTGLGLSISKQLVELFNSTLQVKSIKGKGTTFYFSIEFPIGSSIDLVENKNPLIHPDALKNKRILVVEDNQINQFLVISLLKKWNVILDVAENGKIAIEKLNEQSYDVILMDMQMPIMGGIEATSIIRTKLKLTTPIIALTARAIKGDDKECLNAGMDDYVSKPFNESDLVNKILKLITYGTTTL